MKVLLECEYCSYRWDINDNPEDIPNCVKSPTSRHRSPPPPGGSQYVECAVRGCEKVVEVDSNGIQVRIDPELTRIAIEHTDVPKMPSAAAMFPIVESVKVESIGIVDVRNQSLPPIDPDGYSFRLSDGRVLRPPQHGVKADAGKDRWSLLPWEQIGDVVRVLTYGAKKYPPNNWKKIVEWEDRYASAAMRHIASRLAGERRDPETGLPHLAHAVCCLLFMMWFDDSGNDSVDADS